MNRARKKKKAGISGLGIVSDMTDFLRKRQHRCSRYKCMYQCAEDEFAESWDNVGCSAQGKQLKQKPELEVYRIQWAEEYMTCTGVCN